MRQITVPYGYAGLLIIVLVALLLAGNLWAATPALPKGIVSLDGKPAPALLLKDQGGKPYNLSSFKGQWVMVHFWASWCGPCRREMPALARMRKLISPERLGLLMINTAESEDVVFSFMSIAAPELNTLMDSDGLVTETWQPRGLPSSFLVDPRGRLRYLALGGRAWDTPPYIAFLERISSP